MSEASCACGFLTMSTNSVRGTVDKCGDYHHTERCLLIGGVDGHEAEEEAPTEKPTVKDYPLSRKTLTEQNIPMTAYEMELCIDGLTTMMEEMDSHLVNGAHVAVDHWSTHGDMATLRLRLQGELEKELQ